MAEFFEPGRTYLHHGEDGQPSTEGLFRVEHVGRAPEPFESYDETAGVAFGWRQGIDANGNWTGLGSYSTPDFAGWQEVRPALDAESPDGCRWCGIPQPHGGQYLPGIGWHQWQQPTDRQRLERMQARRAAKDAQPAPERVDLNNLTGIALRLEDLGVEAHTEYGARFEDGTTMLRPNRQMAETTVRAIQGRDGKGALMTRQIITTDWTEVEPDAASRARLV